METTAERRRAVHVGLILLACAAGLAALWLAREVVLLGFLGVLIGVVFSFPVGWLSRILPRGAAVLLVLLALVGATVGLAALAAPTIQNEVDQLRESAPRAVQKLQGWMRRVESTTGGGGGQKQSAAQKAPEVAAKVGEKALPALIALVSGVTAVVLVIVLGAFLVYQPDVYQRGIRMLVPRRHHGTFDEAWQRVGDGLRKWVGGIIVSMAIMGTLTAVGLLIVGIEQWLLLGVLTFLGTFVPYVGAIASAVPGLLAGLAQSPRHFVLAGVVYLGVHLVEGYLVQPLVMRRAVDVRPALLLVGQGLFGAVFGLMGTIVATPMLVCLQELTKYLWVERRLGKDPEREAAAPSK
ncbi:MAG TPA: AI-2E family transporter [Myxococcales bacterium]|nr:AI-2E family transporter [Myxococcales bacterium]